MARNNLARSAALESPRPLSASLRISSRSYRFVASKYTGKRAPRVRGGNWACPKRAFVWDCSWPRETIHQLQPNGSIVVVTRSSSPVAKFCPKEKTRRGPHFCDPVDNTLIDNVARPEPGLRSGATPDRGAPVVMTYAQAGHRTSRRPRILRTLLPHHPPSWGS